MQLELTFKDENVIEQTMRLLNLNTENLAISINNEAYRRKMNFSITRGRIVNMIKGNANITKTVTRLCEQLLFQRFLPLKENA